MVEFQLTEIASGLDARVHGQDVAVRSVSTDSRTLQAGDFFVALKGPTFDGHDHLQQAHDKHAVAAMVSHVIPDNLPCVQVEDTRIGLGKLAAMWRQRAAAKVVGVTGSNGKTTVKEMLAAILTREGDVLATRGNLNNDIGMPLTLTRLQSEAFAVIEMGANHPGEIDYLSKIAAPDVAILNNAGRAHLEGFGDELGVANAKLEIINGLANDGTFIFNADDAFAAMWREASSALRCLTFGVKQSADISSPEDSLQLQWSEHGFRSEFIVNAPAGEFKASLQLAGAHNRMNALAAVAAASALGVSIESMQAGLASVQPVPGRLCLRHGVNGSWLVDDSYNANPDSVEMAIQVLQAAPGKRILVLGDLGELGENAEALHEGIGFKAKQAGIDHLFTCGKLSGLAAGVFGAGAEHFAEQDQLITQLAALVGEGDTILVKGSRAAAMEKVVEALQGGQRAC